MSNWLTERLTDSRSSARSAPISYTAPVKPPPPSTSAVFDCRGRPLGLRPAVAPAARSRVPLSSLTTLPIGQEAYETAPASPAPGLVIGAPRRGESSPAHAPGSDFRGPAGFPPSNAALDAPDRRARLPPP